MESVDVIGLEWDNTSAEGVLEKPQNITHERDDDNEGTGKMEKITNLDEAIEASGSCGFFQISRHIMIFFMILPFAAQNLFMTFGGNMPTWRCVKHNNTKCTYLGEIKRDSKLYHKICSMQRSDWEFTKRKEWSLVTEYDLICSREYLGHVAGSAFFVGAVPGALTFGWAADRYGRKRLMIPFMLCSFVTNIVAAVTNGVAFFILLRFLCGFFVSGFFVGVFVIACEIVGPNFRPLSGTLLWNHFAVGACLLGLEAYFLENWRHLEYMTTLPFIFIFAFVWFIPESMRWLWVTGKTEKSRKIFKQIAKQNGKPVPSLKGINYTEDSINKTRVSFLIILKSKKLMFRTAVQAYAWFVQGLVYYAFFLISDNLSGDIFRDFTLTAIIEIPANFLCIYFSKRFGRKKTFLVSGFICLTLTSVIAIMAVKDHEVVKYVRLGLGMIGKLFVVNGVNAMYLWSAELYPTVLRSQAMGFFMAVRPLGGAAAPWLTTWIHGFHVSLPFALLSVLMGIEILLCLSLPETKGMPMADDLGKDDCNKSCEKEG